MSVVIERVRQADEELVKHLFRSAGMEFEQINEAFFADGRNYLLVAREGHKLLGFLYAYLLDAPHSLRPQMFLYSINVFPEFQRRGVGRALIEELKKIAREGRCSEIFVLTNAANLPANLLYQKTGGIRENPDDVMYVYPL